MYVSLDCNECFCYKLQHHLAFLGGRKACNHLCLAFVASKQACLKTSLSDYIVLLRHSILPLKIHPLVTSGLIDGKLHDSQIFSSKPPFLLASELWLLLAITVALAHAMLAAHLHRVSSGKC